MSSWSHYAPPQVPHSTSPPGSHASSRPLKPHPSPDTVGSAPSRPPALPNFPHSTQRPRLPRQPIILPFSMSSWSTHPSHVPYSILPLSASHPSSGPIRLPSTPLSRYFWVLFPQSPYSPGLPTFHLLVRLPLFMLARLLPQHRVPSKRTPRDLH